jgi:hypothetical protein
MPADRPEGRHGPRPLADLFDPRAGSAQIAATLATAWREVDSALNPVIGQRGVAALFDRSLHLSARRHPWLLAGHDGTLAQLDPTALQATAAAQDAAAAAAGAVALCTAFHGLLASLVGPTLTDRMLQGIWQPPRGDTPAQDTAT